eukprot:763686-Hanusia_phi.AAC.1
MGNCLAPHSIDGMSDKLKKFYKIQDTFDSIEKVQTALRQVGLESSNLIVGTHAHTHTCNARQG